MSSKDSLDIIDEKGKIIGRAGRLEVHQKGLLHRESHVWLYTPKGELIWQLRSKTKETFPDKLDATIGGHVDVGMDYLNTAVKETREETGLKISPQALKHIGDTRVKIYDASTGLTNNVIRRNYVLRFEGKIKDLKIEEGEITGFEAWPIEKLLHLTEAEKKKFIPNLIDTGHLKMYQKIQKLL